MQGALSNTKPPRKNMYMAVFFLYFRTYIYMYTVQKCACISVCLVIKCNWKEVRSLRLYVDSCLERDRLYCVIRK